MPRRASEVRHAKKRPEPQEAPGGQMGRCRQTGQTAFQTAVAPIMKVWSEQKPPPPRSGRRGRGGGARSTPATAAGTTLMGLYSSSSRTQRWRPSEATEDRGSGVRRVGGAAERAGARSAVLWPLARHYLLLP